MQPALKVEGQKYLAHNQCCLFLSSWENTICKRGNRAEGILFGPGKDKQQQGVTIDKTYGVITWIAGKWTQVKVIFYRMK